MTPMIRERAFLGVALGVVACCTGAMAQNSAPPANPPVQQDAAKPFAATPPQNPPAAEPTVAQRIPPAENAAPPKPEAETPAHPAPAKPAKPHKVITNEDIDAAHAHDAGKIGDQKYGAPIFGTPLCDEECAQTARAELGIGEEDEGEWQMQLATARRNLAADQAWLRAYANASQKTKMYCDFLQQQRNVILPQGNDYWARVDRYKHEQYAENMNRTLSQGVQGAFNQVNQFIEGVEPVEPVRATIMSVISRQILNSCPLYIDP
jgi:hypothetical protein